MIEVTLTPVEMLRAAAEGTRRQNINRAHGRRDAHGLSRAADGWGPHIEGACGELAVAKALNKFWSGACGELRARDVGNKYEVRTTATRTLPNGDPSSLFLYESDPDDAPFILAIGRAPTFEIVGWITGREGKHTKYWNGTRARPGFLVPYPDLHAIETLDRDDDAALDWAIAAEDARRAAR